MLLGALLLAQAVGDAPPAPPPRSPAPQSATLATVHDEELLLLSVTLDGATLSESLGAYGDPADPLLPVGEMARLLGLDIRVLPSEARVEGTIGPARRSLLVDLRAGVARLGGSDVPLAPAQVAASPRDLYVRASAMERLLPIRIAVDSEGLLLTLTATEPLPIQERAEREQRMRQLERGAGKSNGEPVLRVETPYRLVSLPTFDFALETGYDSRRALATRRYDLRAAADLLGTDFTGYLGSDERGQPSVARVRFDRRSPGGRLLGPLGATYAAIGDVFTPVMSTGPISTGGRGFQFSTAPLGQASVFQRITLRGELPIGYQVELYVNDVLRGAQRFPVEGRYEFLDVPLVRGLNVLRIVTYGPNGERNEQSRVLNVGGGQIERGKLTLDFGLVQQDREVIALARAGGLSDGFDMGEGKLRAVARLAYGLSDTVTLVGGGALYPDTAGQERKMLSAGLRGSLAGVALLGDYSHDFTGGSAVSLGAAGQAGGVAATLRHVEYRGDFLDENNLLADLTRPLRRDTTLDANFSLGLGGARVPLVLRVERSVFQDDGVTWLGSARASSILADTLVSAGLDYRRDAPRFGRALDRLTGNLAASRFLAYVWQVRGVLDYDLAPDPALRSFSLTVDRNLSDLLGVHLGIGRTFGPDEDVQFQGGAYLHLAFADLALTGDYSTATRDWRFGLRLAFGLALDPSSNQVRATRPGVASGGSATVNAFIDADGDGHRDADEAPVPGLRLAGGERIAVTGADGRAFVTGLGDSPVARLSVDMRAVDAFYVQAPPDNIELAPRPGVVARIDYPFRPVGEVSARLWVVRANGQRTGLAAVQARLTGARGAFAATSQYDGSLVFEAVPPGDYRLVLDPAQAAQLRMRLEGDTAVTVKPDGTASEISADIRFGDAP
jgi:hypothetical protein